MATGRIRALWDLAGRPTAPHWGGAGQPGRPGPSLEPAQPRPVCRSRLPGAAVRLKPPGLWPGDRLPAGAMAVRGWLQLVGVLGSAWIGAPVGAQLRPAGAPGRAPWGPEFGAHGRPAAPIPFGAAAAARPARTDGCPVSRNRAPLTWLAAWPAWARLVVPPGFTPSCCATTLACKRP